MEKIFIETIRVTAIILLLISIVSLVTLLGAGLYYAYTGNVWLAGDRALAMGAIAFFSCLFSFLGLIIIV